VLSDASVRLSADWLLKHITLDDAPLLAIPYGNTYLDNISNTL